MAKKRLQSLKPHPGIQELAGERMAKTMQCIALVPEPCFFQVLDKYRSCRSIGNTLIFPSVDQHVFSGIFFLQPGDQGIFGVRAEIDHFSRSRLSGLMDEHLLLPEINVLHPERKKL